jgi:hypothetical protein
VNVIVASITLRKPPIPKGHHANSLHLYIWDRTLISSARVPIHARTARHLITILRRSHVSVLHYYILQITCIFVIYLCAVPITVATRFMAWTVFARSKTGIVGSNPTWGMDVCVCVYSVFVSSCVYVASLRRADPPSKESWRLCKRSRNWKSGQGPTKGCRAKDRFMRSAKWTQRVNDMFLLSDRTFFFPSKYSDGIWNGRWAKTRHATWIFNIPPTGRQEPG